MAIFRHLNTLLETNHRRSRPFRTFLSTTAASQSTSSSLAILSPPPLLFRNTHLLLSSHSPLSKLVLFPFHGPLFLSPPPWKLSQSATPLHIQGDLVLFPKKLQALRLLQRTAVRFPIKLRLGNKTAYFDKQRAEPITFVGGGLAESFINLPNSVSLSRMMSGPVLGWMIINEWYAPAFIGLAISGATDWLDGFLARKMGINSVVGSYLDPLADKVLIGCVAITMVENNLLHPGLVGLVVLRDVLLVGGAVYNRANSLDWKWKSLTDFINLDGTRPKKVKPLFISKVNTVFQLMLVAAALLQPELGTNETEMYINYLSWLVAGTTLASTAGYGAQYMRMRSRSLPTIRGC